MKDKRGRANAIGRVGNDGEWRWKEGLNACPLIAYIQFVGLEYIPSLGT
jgi:hypothetical protein